MRMNWINVNVRWSTRPFFLSLFDALKQILDIDYVIRLSKSIKFVTEEVLRYIEDISSPSKNTLFFSASFDEMPGRTTK